MREIPQSLADRFQAGLSTTALCWRLERPDGLVIGVTQHDREIAFDGVVYRPGAALEHSELTQVIELAPGRASARSALSHDAIAEDDLAAGLWTASRVDVFRADWSAPHEHVHVWAGYLSEIRHSAAGYEAELVSLKADFERLVGRLFSRRCDAVFGDQRCGIDASAPEHAGQSCDKQLSTCRDRFANIENFRGFPHMPGPDFVLAGPAARGNDGGSR